MPLTPGAPPDLVSPDRDAAYTVVTAPMDFERLADWGKDVRELTGSGGGGLSVHGTGDSRPVFRDGASLLDSFVVRTLMVPAAVELLGNRVWWPSDEHGGGWALRECADTGERAVAA